MAPILVERVGLKSRHGAHWLTFDIEGNYAYVAPNKSSDDATEIFDAHTHKSVGLIGSSEDMIEIDFADGKVSRVGDQYGVGRVVRGPDELIGAVAKRCVRQHPGKNVLREAKRIRTSLTLPRWVVMLKHARSLDLIFVVTVVQAGQGRLAV